MAPATCMLVLRSGSDLEATRLPPRDLAAQEVPRRHRVRDHVEQAGHSRSQLATWMTAPGPVERSTAFTSGTRGAKSSIRLVRVRRTTIPIVYRLRFC